MTEDTAPAEHEPTCAACQVVMELGCLPEFYQFGTAFTSYVATHDAVWRRGKFKRYSQFDDRVPQEFPVTAYRCPKCSRLELFAFARAWKKVE